MQQVPTDDWRHFADEFRRYSANLNADVEVVRREAETHAGQYVARSLDGTQT